jgi:hypothetical protein
MRCALRRRAVAPRAGVTLTHSWPRPRRAAEPPPASRRSRPLAPRARLPLPSASQALQAAGALSKWGAAAGVLPARRGVLPGELRQMGIKSPDKMGVPSTRNEQAFLVRPGVHARECVRACVCVCVRACACVCAPCV